VLPCMYHSTRYEGNRAHAAFRSKIADLPGELASEDVGKFVGGVMYVERGAIPWSNNFLDNTERIACLRSGGPNEHRAARSQFVHLFVGRNAKEPIKTLCCHNSSLLRSTDP